MDVKLYFFQSPGTSTDYHNFSNIKDSGQVTTSANSTRTLGCISSGLIDVQVPQVITNLIFVYSRKVVAFLIPSYQTKSLRAVWQSVIRED